MSNTHYIENDDIQREWEKWKSTGKPSDLLIQQIYQIATHLLTHKRFVRYPYHEKEDMTQEAVMKCLQNLKNYKPEKGIIFSYLTRCCWTAFVVYLAKYYKNINRRRQDILDALENLDDSQVTASEYLKQLMKNIDETLQGYQHNQPDVPRKARRKKF